MSRRRRRSQRCFIYGSLLLGASLLALPYSVIMVGSGHGGTLIPILLTAAAAVVSSLLLIASVMLARSAISAGESCPWLGFMYLILTFEGIALAFFVFFLR